MVEDSFKVNNYSRPVDYFYLFITLYRLEQWTLTHLCRKRRRSVKGERKPSLSDPSDSGRPDRVQLVILSVSSLSPSSVRFNGRLDRVPVISCRYFVPCCVSLYYRVSLSTRFLLNFGISTPDVGRNDRWESNRS